MDFQPDSQKYQPPKKRRSSGFGTKELATALMLATTPNALGQPPEQYIEQRADIELLFHNAQIQILPEELEVVRELDSRVPGIAKILIGIEKRTGSRIRASSLARAAAEAKFDPKSLRNNEFVDGLEEFGRSDYPFLNLLPPAHLGRRGHTLFEKRIADPQFRALIADLRTTDVVRGEHKVSDYLSLKPENYTSPHFLKNLRIVKDAIPGLYPHSVVEDQKALADVDTEEILLGAAGDARFAALVFVGRAIEKNDRDLLRILRIFQQKLKGSYVQEAFLYLLDGVRLRDSEYMRVYEESTKKIAKELEANPDQGPGSADGGESGESELDKEYVLLKTGRTLSDHGGSLRAYMETLRSFEGTDPTLFHILNARRTRMLLQPVLKMNDMHNKSPCERLKALEGLDARTLFEVLTQGGADAFLSTFRLTYDGNSYAGKETYNAFLSTALREKNTLYEFMQELRPSRADFSKFLLSLTRHGYLDTFLKTIGSAERQTKIFSDFLFDVRHELTNAQAVSLGSLLNETKNELLRTFIFGELRAVLENTSPENAQRKILSGLLVAQNVDQAHVPEWARESIRLYAARFPNISALEASQAFREIGGIATNIQHHVFYDDRKEKGGARVWDGHHSFSNFIEHLGGKVTWDAQGEIQKITVGKGARLEDKGDYVLITQESKVRGRRILMYANKPDRTFASVTAAFQMLQKEQPPHIVVHRGHSFHAPNTVRLLRPDVAFVNFASCGGVNEIEPALRVAPGAQIAGTSGVGTMLVNDPLLRAVNINLLRGGKIEWSTLKKQLDGYFKKVGGVAEERWEKYTLPHENQTARLIAAMNELVDDDGSFVQLGGGGGGN